MKAKAVRLVREHGEEYGTEWAARERDDTSRRGHISDPTHAEIDRLAGSRVTST